MEQLLEQYKKGWSLPRDFYMSRQVLDQEADAIWKHNWLFAGFSCEIPEPGDYFTYAILDQSVIIIRNDDGKIYAHHNSCRHRGSAICIEERGHEDKLKCPYHNWVYDKEGQLRNARLMPDDFDKSQFGLHSVHLTNVAGAIFISLADNPPDFSQESADLAPYLQPYQLEGAKVAYRDRYELEANWKLIGENFRECYHCGPVHIEYCSVVVGANLVENRDTVLQDSMVTWQQQGLASATIENGPEASHYATRYPLRPGMESYTLDGKPAAPLMGRHTQYDSGVVGLINYPNFWMDGVSDYIWAMRITPIDATRSMVDLTWLVDGKAEEGMDYELERLTEFWKITGEQDWHLCENNQKGIRSSKYEPGPMAPSEEDVVNFHTWYLNRMRQGLTKPR
ncbi:aromatic ring-hydroxylating oxygenase subunit alpha [Chitinophaga barathri]|uniref:Aromatic ring-hydroxylating dioxygenase subunit alpha n=1 Tax=Chitinophaga barathri TaxID=1647451 RepID=A0A3N4MF12_9BACT|nr:aromatic ring-hydroxylating dioxygenase subunit alpha [Chitinophaga barathri]RPD42592.1 aromatic ring-hydroxylating dioxygenase subunit alpha [Chitinophaga barathri]